MAAVPIVLAATPLTGHIRPVLNLARHLVAAGRRVTVVSGSRPRRSARPPPGTAPFPPLRRSGLIDAAIR